jgi:hypothetical protein
VSQPIHIVRPSEEDLLAWVGKLPAQEKDALLVRFSLGEELHLGAEIIGRYLKQKKDLVMPSILKPKRTVGELPLGRRNSGITVGAEVPPVKASVVSRFHRKY